MIGTLLESSQNNESAEDANSRLSAEVIQRPPAENHASSKLMYDQFEFLHGSSTRQDKIKKKFKPNCRTLRGLDNRLIDFSFLDFSKTANNVGLVSF